MPGTFELRTYTLKTPELATEYSTKWKGHIGSLRQFNIETKAVFLSKTDPKKVIALVQYREGDDPQVTTKAYMQSEGFKKDMSGFDFTNFESVESTTLEALEWLPTQ